MARPQKLTDEQVVSPLLFSTNPFNRLAASADSIVGGGSSNLPTFISCPTTTNIDAPADEFMASEDLIVGDDSEKIIDEGADERLPSGNPETAIIGTDESA